MMSGKNWFRCEKREDRFCKLGQEDPVIETEEDLTGAIDELPAGTEEEPSDVIVETEISVTNPVTVKDKYITLGGGGTLNSLNSGGIFSVNNGGLVLDNITLKGQWIDKRPLLEVLNGSILNIHPNTMITRNRIICDGACRQDQYACV